MFRYYAWAIAEKGLSYVPLGKRVYATVGRLVKRKTCGTKYTMPSLRLARVAKQHLTPGSVAMEVGTGWFHHDALLMYLVCDGVTVNLFDVEDKATLGYIHNYVRTLLANLDDLVTQLDLDAEHTRRKLEPLLRFTDRDALYSHCQFVPSIISDPRTPWLAEGSVDFMVSNCVLNHIPRKVLGPELVALKRMLKQDGVMYHLLGHDDHWSFHDRSVNMFNYYRYSDRYYRWFFETKLEFQNRMVKGEWLEFFDLHDLEVLDYYGFVTSASSDAIREIQIDQRYARWSLDDLAIVHSYVLLARRHTRIDAERTDATEERVS